MTAKKKVCVLFTEGISLRNFAYSDFYTRGKAKQFEVSFVNTTGHQLDQFSLNEQRLKARPHWRTDVLKRVLINLNLARFAKQGDAEVYQSYRFNSSYKGFKGFIKSLVYRYYYQSYRHHTEALRKAIKNSERKTEYYKRAKTLWQTEQPAMVFCTSQRAVTAIAPLTAAQDLGIPTASFIYSWDNLPKATLVVETDYYFVWSDYMKQELLQYYPYIQSHQVVITGTPQFFGHFQKDLISTKAAFFEAMALDPQRKYLCFSGDDVTTSPDDPQYLADAAEAVQQLNQEGYRLGILFRRCPVDLSGRYDAVIEQYEDIIVPVAPLWKAQGEVWNQIVPTPEDVALLANTAAHCEAVINLGSSMVFDFAIHNKPCIFIKYDVKEKALSDWSAEKIYKFIHFRSMPSKEAVLWANSADALAASIKTALVAPQKTVKAAQDWMQVINLAPHNQASQHIWEAIEKILQ